MGGVSSFPGDFLIESLSPPLCVATRRIARRLWLLCVLVSACAQEPDPSPGRMTRVDPPAGPGAMAPNLTADGDGALMTWLEPAGEGRQLRAARLDRDGSWTPARTVAEGDDFVANWADFPGIARGSDGALLAYWLEKSGPDTYAYDVQLAGARNTNSTFRPLGRAHDDGVQAEHGFVSMIAEPDAVRLFWLDGRATRGVAADAAGADEAGAMTLRTALVRGGAVTKGELLDPRVCDCCQTAAAMTADGPVVVYRDRSEDEVRDIRIIRRTSEGWSAPGLVHEDRWVVPGCPVNGPSIATAGPERRHLVVAWFTAADNEPKVLIAFSSDSGATFDPPVSIDAAAPLGRVSVVSIDEDEAVVGWVAGADESQASIRLARVRTDGSVGEPLIVTGTSSSRASGFPRMVRLHDDLLIAWTEPGEPSAVRAARVPFVMLPGPPVRSTAASPRPLPAGRVWDRRTGSMAPDYSAEAADGRIVGLTSMRGEPVLVNLWATWCVPCRAEIPALHELHERYGSRGLRVVGVSVDVDLPSRDVFAFAAKEKIPYLILHDPQDRASALFTGQQMLPASFLFDREGVLIWSHVGLLRHGDPELTRHLERVLSRAALPETNPE